MATSPPLAPNALHDQRPCLHRLAKPPARNDAQTGCSVQHSLSSSPHRHACEAVVGGGNADDRTATTPDLPDGHDVHSVVHVEAMRYTWCSSAAFLGRDAGDPRADPVILPVMGRQGYSALS